MPLAKEQIRQLIKENDFGSVTDVYTYLKEGFKDILQELMEAELDASIGYEKNQKGDLDTDNKRNGHSPKTLKSQYGEFQIEVPRDKPFVKQDWQFWNDYYRLRYGKVVEPVKPQKGKPRNVPTDTVCPLCGAPHEYIYDNSGGRGQLNAKSAAKPLSMGKK